MKLESVSAEKGLCTRRKFITAAGADGVLLYNQLIKSRN